jgi:hypothetical protein
MISRLFTEKHLADRLLADRHLADRHLVDTALKETFHPINCCPNSRVEETFCRQNVSRSNGFR